MRDGEEVAARRTTLAFSELGPGIKASDHRGSIIQTAPFFNRTTFLFDHTYLFLVLYFVNARPAHGFEFLS